MIKLRNNRTEKIINSEELLTDDFMIDLFSKDFDYFKSRLDKIREEWEVVLEEPKEYYFITWCGNVDKETDDDYDVDIECKSIGNYFETKEEAEKAVERLKAWKRLKDKGFRFEGWTIDDGLRISICTNFDSDGIYDEHRKEVKKDLDACFGGEE